MSIEKTGSLSPTAHDSLSPTMNDTLSPTAHDSLSPTAHDSLSPTMNDTLSATAHDSLSPTAHDSLSPTAHDSLSPTAHDSLSPTAHDSLGLDTDIGVSKNQFMNSISAAAKRGMKFNLIAMDSCESFLKEWDDRPFDDIVGSSSKIGYQSVDYKQLGDATAANLSTKIADLFRSSGKFS